MRLKDMEFNTDQITGDATCHNLVTGDIIKITPDKRELIGKILNISETFYPEQYKALNIEYKRYSDNKINYDFVRARRVVNCCLGANDRNKDFDEKGRINIENVTCPLICECRWHKVICQPKFNSNLSARELEVMEKFYHGSNDYEIADELCLSIYTVNNHRKNAFKRLGLHSMPEFMRYAIKNNLFNNN